MARYCQLSPSFGIQFSLLKCSKCSKPCSTYVRVRTVPFWPPGKKRRIKERARTTVPVRLPWTVLVPGTPEGLLLHNAQCTMHIMASCRS
jgi:hypothetical protein